MSKIKVEDIRIGNEMGGNVALGCAVGADRFHFWIHPRTGKIEGGIVYKNSVADAGQKGYYNTRTLSAEKGVGREIVGLLMPHLRAALKTFRSEEAQKAIAEAEKARQARAVQRIRDAAPEILQALEDLVRAVDAGCGTEPELPRAKAALAKAQKGGGR